MSKEEIKDMVDEVVEDEVQNEIRTVAPTDPEWVDFILDQLADHELANGAPTTDGLRRVTEKVFGEIVGSDTEILEIPKEAYIGKASAKHTLVIQKYSTDSIVSVSACVDVLGKKLPDPFRQHLVSTACTRAEGKALRRALKIRVQTAEELSNTDDNEFNLDEPIDDQQIYAIKTMCKRNDVDIIKFVKAHVNKPKTIRDAKNLEGRLMINKLSGYQREGTPKELMGYKENWEDNFGGIKK